MELLGCGRSLSDGARLAVCLIVLSVEIISTNAWAAYSVVISTGTTYNMSYTGGVYSPTGAGAILNVTALQGALASASGSVTVKTGSTGTGSGVISVPANVTWSANTLVLDAYNGIAIGGTMSATSTAGLTLTTSDGGSGTIGFNGNVTFANLTEVLTINGNVYQLVNNLSTLNSEIGSYSFFALSNNDNESSSLTSTPVSNTLTVPFEGLGNTISNVTINAASTSLNPIVDAALFNQVGDSSNSPGSVSDLNLSNISITGNAQVNGTNPCEGSIAGLVVTNYGNLSNVSLINSGTAAISLTNNTCGSSFGQSSTVGGLVAVNMGSITNSSTNTPISSALTYTWMGGLIGVNSYQSGVTNSAAVSGSYASGLVGAAGAPAANAYGGLIGANGGPVSNSYSSSTVAGYVNTGTNNDDEIGGLIGLNIGAVVLSSYATGAVSGSGSEIGGLVGFNTLTDGGTPGQILSSYATGDVTGTGFIEGTVGGLVGYNGGGIIGGVSGSTYEISYATGSVTSVGSFTGGLVGLNGPMSGGIGGTIQYAYATGSVSNSTNMGGLVGINNGTIDQSFTATTSIVSSSTVSELGGFVGQNSGAIKNSYSLGAVSNGEADTSAGGFAGVNQGATSQTIAHAYEAGPVSYTGSVSSCSSYANAGFVGLDTNTTDVTDAYYDSSENALPLTGRGCPTGQTGIHAKTTSQLTSGLPSGLSSTYWGWASGTNCGYPYLLNNPPAGSCSMAARTSRPKGDKGSKSKPRS